MNTKITEGNLNLSPTFEETVGTKEYPELNDNQKIWLAALPAIIMSSNKSKLDTLEVEEITEASIEKWKKILSRDWSIDNRDDLIETIAKMEYSGHDDSYNLLKNLMIENEYIPLQDILKQETLSSKNRKYYAFLQIHREEYENIDLIAWDLGRMTSLVRWGYQVGFLSEPESWNIMLYFGQKIQKYYSSWEEYGRAYGLGRIFWASGFGKEDSYRDKTEPIVADLLSETGLWNSLKWKTNLSEPNIKTLNDREVTALTEEAEEIDRMLNVSARKYKTVYFSLGDHFLRADDLEKAYYYYTKGLRLYAGDWETQIRMAKIEYLREDYSGVSGRLNHLIKNCNDYQLLQTAGDLLSRIPEIEEISIPDNYEKVLLIHQYDYIPDNIMAALKSRISQEFKIRVWTGHEEVELSEDNFRSPQEMLDRYVYDILKDFEENRIDNYKEILGEIGIGEKTVLTYDDKYAFVRYLYFQSEEGQAVWPHLINKMTPQYDAGIQRQVLMRGYADELKKPNVLGVLGVTLKDIYAEDYNFLFGWNGPGGAVMSIYRFYTNDTPLTKIIKRSVNQSFSSTGYILGIPRCTVPDCARAYPHSLAEHDEKEDQLCHECTEALIKLYKIDDKN